MVKTWLESEVWQLMAKEMSAYKHDCTLNRKLTSWIEMAECVYAVMDKEGLIELTP